MNYKEAGVDVEKGDLFIEKIKPFIKTTYNSNVHQGVGGFAALYDQGDHYLATGTDGVGTKIKLAVELGIHDTIGEDLVAMCVNDILCTGARPMFFLDYLATAKLDIEVHSQVVKGITSGCVKAGCALIGGETAEMPGIYQSGDYDLAGFAVGSLPKEKVIDGSSLKPGMKLYGLPSSGFHSNGYSLVRKLIESESSELKKECLTPTRIYTPEVMSLMGDTAPYGMAHITGGGLNNIARMNPKLGYKITQLPQMPNFMQQVIKSANLSKKEEYTTFNMGLGFVFALTEEQASKLSMKDLLEIGTITDEFTGVECLGEKI